MRSAKPGKRTLAAEVTNVSANGFWLLVDDRELFVAFENFPWFRDASIAQVTKVRRPASHHLFWPDLDVDLALDSIDRPGDYPLVSRLPATKTRRAHGRASPRERSSSRARRRA